VTATWAVLAAGFSVVMGTNASAGSQFSPTDRGSLLISVIGSMSLSGDVDEGARLG
jgi:hypothetical protein